VLPEEELDPAPLVVVLVAPLVAAPVPLLVPVPVPVLLAPDAALKLICVPPSPPVLEPLELQPSAATTVARGTRRVATTRARVTRMEGMDDVLVSGG
jgi:hypothetical protein